MLLGIYGFKDGHTHTHTHIHIYILACYTRQWHAPGLNLIFITFAAAKG